jgi:hypothetical protein
MSKIKCPKCIGTLKPVPNSNPTKYQCNRNASHVFLIDQIPGTHPIKPNGGTTSMRTPAILDPETGSITAIDEETNEQVTLQVI